MITLYADCSKTFNKLIMISEKKSTKLKRFCLRYMLHAWFIILHREMDA